jgi:RimJ/RimL family protein N-acetyltransferase
MRLREIRLKDFEYIFYLTNEENIYRYIRNGKKWSEEKTERFILKNIHEQKKTIKERRYFNYIIVSDIGKDVGVIGVKSENKKYSITVFIDPNFQEKGYFTKSINLLKRRVKRYRPRISYLFFQVHQSNKKMNQIMENKYEYVKSYPIGKTTVNEYKFYL